MRVLAGCLVVSAIIALGGSEVVAHSGVQSGPPQVQPGPRSDPDQQPSPGVGTDPQPGGSWVAVAAGFRDGRWVRVGFARRGTRGDAEIAALEACNGGPGGVRCSNPHASSTSCLYIVAGTKRGGVTWGRGATQDVALSECRRGGYACKQKDVIGGCPDRPS